MRSGMAGPMASGAHPGMPGTMPGISFTRVAAMGGRALMGRAMPHKSLSVLPKFTIRLSRFVVFGISPSWYRHDQQDCTSE